MSNGDYIRAMDNERLARFLYTLTLNTIRLFRRSGYKEIMNAAEMSLWIRTEDFVCEETKVDENFTYDQNFDMKMGRIMLNKNGLSYIR